VWIGVEVALLRHGAVAFDVHEAVFDRSRQHIHHFFTIWESEHTGEGLYDALMRACLLGVEVRLLLDDVESRNTRQGFFQPLV